MASGHPASPLQHKLFEARQEPVVVVGGHSLDSHPPGSSVYLAGFALLQLLSILHDNALATAPPSAPSARHVPEPSRSTAPQALATCHHRVIAALVYVFTSLGEQCAPFLPKAISGQPRVISGELG